MTIENKTSQPDIDYSVCTWEDFKKYVETYDPGKSESKIIMHDMIYGIGLLMNKEKYQYCNGYKEFKQYLKENL